MNWLKGLLLVSCLTSICLAEVHDDVETTRNKKILGLFNVVKFPNDNCTVSDSTQGTCFTTSECENKGGKNEGSCASGFGVCCTFRPACGGSSSENNTYLESGSSKLTSYPASCSYKICPSNSKICRIKFDLQTFTIGGPATATTALGALGDCTTDRFSISSPGSQGSPVICGTNSGQHMFMDVTTECLTANFYVNAATSASWKINVIQYACGSEMGGPTGCLQYFVSSDGSGTFSSFNYNGGTGTHLSNQAYTACFRRERNYCYICFSEDATNNKNFALSASDADTNPNSRVDSYCSTDYISVDGGTTSAIAQATAVVTSTPFRNCGRRLATTDSSPTSETVCTRKSPFRVSVVTSEDEASGDVATPMPGTLGFSLVYSQGAC